MYNPDIVYHPPSRRLERTIAWLCGAAFGVVPGCWIVAELALFDRAIPAISVIAVAALTCGYLAQRHGDAFWHKAANAIRAIFGTGV